MFALLYLYFHILFNEYHKKFFSKSTAFGAVLILVLSLFTIGIGFSVGFMVNYIRLHPELDSGNPYYFARIIFLELVFTLIIIKMSGSRVLKQITLNTLKIFPIPKRVIFLFDINIGILDFVSLFFAVFLLAFISGAGGFSISFSTGIIFILFILSLLYFVHVLGELLRSITKFINSLPKIRTTLFLITSLILIYIFVLKGLDLTSVVINNPLSWNVGSVFSLTIFNEDHWLYNVIILNILFSIIGLIFAILIKIIHDNLFSVHTIQIAPQVKKKKLQLINNVSIFPAKLQPYFEKDIRYIFRSSHALSAIILELLLLVFVGYMHFTNAKFYDKVYFPAGFIITIPIMIWDFLLSNSWGLERRGFGFYLYSNVDYKILLQSKNLSFIITRMPVIILISLFLSIIFSFKYLPIFILLYIISNILSLSFSNIVSIKNPFPVDFKESSMSQKKQQSFSMIGFIGLMIYLILPAAILFMLYKLGAGLVFYSIILALLFLLIILYKKMTLYSSVLLFKQKEIIYKKLVKI